MSSPGFSLIETVAAVAIFSILAALAVLSFHKWERHFRTDAQMRLMYSELLKARVDAIYHRRGTRVKVFADRFEIYSSLRDGAGVAPRIIHSLSYRVTNSLHPGGEATIDFSETGMTTDLCSVCLEDTADTGGGDSLVVAACRTRIGKKDEGEECNGDNITSR